MAIVLHGLGKTTNVQLWLPINDRVIKALCALQFHMSSEKLQKVQHLRTSAVLFLFLKQVSGPYGCADKCMGNAEPKIRLHVTVIGWEQAGKCYRTVYSKSC